MKLHHIGIACKNIEKEIVSLQRIHPNIQQSKIVFDPLQDVNLCMITLEDGTKLELVSGNPIQKFLEHKTTYYHICYEVEDIHKEINNITNNGGFLILKPTPAVLFNGRLVCFLLVSYGIIELLNK